MSTVTLNRARLAPPEFTRRRLQQQMSEPAVPGYHLPPPSVEALARQADAVARERSRAATSTAGR